MSTVLRIESLGRDVSREELRELIGRLQAGCRQVRIERFERYTRLGAVLVQAAAAMDLSEDAVREWAGVHHQTARKAVAFWRAFGAEDGSIDRPRFQAKCARITGSPVHAPTVADMAKDIGLRPDRRGQDTNAQASMDIQASTPPVFACASAPENGGGVEASNGVSGLAGASGGAWGVPSMAQLLGGMGGEQGPAISHQPSGGEAKQASTPPVFACASAPENRGGVEARRDARTGAAGEPRGGSREGGWRVGPQLGLDAMYAEAEAAMERVVAAWAGAVGHLDETRLRAVVAAVRGLEELLGMPETATVVSG